MFTSSPFLFSIFSNEKKLTQPVFDQFFVSVYNMIYTAMPVLALGTFDKDVDERMSLKFSKLYYPGQVNMFFNRTRFAQSAIHGILTSLVLFGVTLGERGCPLMTSSTCAWLAYFILSLFFNVELSFSSKVYFNLNL